MEELPYNQDKELHQSPPELHQSPSISTRAPPSSTNSIKSGKDGCKLPEDHSRGHHMGTLLIGVKYGQEVQIAADTRVRTHRDLKKSAAAILRAKIDFRSSNNTAKLQYYQEMNKHCYPLTGNEDHGMDEGSEAKLVPFEVQGHSICVAFGGLLSARARLTDTLVKHRPTTLAEFFRRLCRCCAEAEMEFLEWATVATGPYAWAFKKRGFTTYVEKTGLVTAMVGIVPSEQIAAAAEKAASLPKVQDPDAVAPPEQPPAFEEYEEAKIRATRAAIVVLKGNQTKDVPLTELLARLNGSEASGPVATEGVESEYACTRVEREAAAVAFTGRVLTDGDVRRCIHQAFAAAAAEHYNQLIVRNFGAPPNIIDGMIASSFRGYRLKSDKPPEGIGLSQYLTNVVRTGGPNLALRAGGPPLLAHHAGPSGLQQPPQPEKERDAEWQVKEGKRNKKKEAGPSGGEVRGSNQPEHPRGGGGGRTNEFRIPSSNMRSGKGQPFSKQHSKPPGPGRY